MGVNEKQAEGHIGQSALIRICVSHSWAAELPGICKKVQECLSILYYWQPEGSTFAIQLKQSGFGCGLHRRMY